MKCQRLFIAKRSILSICVVGSLVLIPAVRPFACDCSSQPDGGGSTSDSSDSSGSGTSDTGRSGGSGAKSGSEASSNGPSDTPSQPDGQGSTADSRNGNGPSSFKLIECSNPLWSDFLPCFERMVKSREAFVSQPKED
jgi:hypothetical protein